MHGFSYMQALPLVFGASSYFSWNLGRKENKLDFIGVGKPCQKYGSEGLLICVACIKN
jgi:hypothetical protein